MTKTKLEQLQDAGLVEKNYKFTDDEKAAIESLSDAEVNHLISSKQKLGEGFIKKHVPHGMMF
jgi:hypothetical protein